MGSELMGSGVGSTLAGSTSVLIWGMIFGSIGVGFLIYGKRQRAIIPLIIGIALSVFPFFISNVYLLVIVGVILVMLPYFVRL